MFRTIRKKIFRLAVVSGVGAAASYFFDRDNGESRRNQAKDKANGLFGKAAAGGSWQAPAERSANGFEPQVVPATPPPAPTVSTVTAPPRSAGIIEDITPVTPTTPSAPVSGA